MPNPIEIILVPISLAALTILVILLLIEACFPARQLSKLNNWWRKCVFSFSTYLATFLPLVASNYLTKYQLLNFSDLNVWQGCLVSLFSYQIGMYTWL